MAASRLVNGVQREIWREGVAQGGGVSQIVLTSIRVSSAQLCRIKGLLTVDVAVGTPIITTALAVSSTGFLQITVSNIAAGGNTATWTLDVQLLQSQDQVNRGATGYVLVASGSATGLAAPQTLAATYALGAVPADERMIIDTGKGPVVVEASTAVVTADGSSLEVRQHDTWAVPMMIRRAGAIAPGPNLQFTKARGTLAAPAAVAANDELGTIDFYGYSAAAYTLDARIVAICNNATPAYATELDFYVTRSAGALTKVAVLNASGPGASTILELYNTPSVMSNVNHTGALGSNSNIWYILHVDSALVYDNIRMNGVVAAGGATHTIILTNASVMPGATADQVYIGSNDFGLLGTHLATLAISAEQPAVSPPAEYTVAAMIPIIYNGVSYYLLATQDEPPA